MTELILGINQFQSFIDTQKGRITKQPITVIRDKHEYTLYHVMTPLSSVQRIISAIKALMIIVFTCFLGLFFKKVTILWNEAFKGRSYTILTANPKDLPDDALKLIAFNAGINSISALSQTSKKLNNFTSSLQFWKDLANHHDIDYSSNNIIELRTQILFLNKEKVIYCKRDSTDDFFKNKIATFGKNHYVRGPHTLNQRIYYCDSDGSIKTTILMDRKLNGNCRYGNGIPVEQITDIPLKNEVERIITTMTEVQSKIA